MKYDFSGYATKHGVLCADGRIIDKGAFRDCDGQTVPLVFQHNHTSPDHVLGNIKLEVRDDGVYGYGSFNDTTNGRNAKAMVKHGDITHMSIYANQVKQTGRNVTHGMIREVSLVLAGANPEARIDNVAIAHGTYDEEIEDEVVIHSGIAIDATPGETVEHADDEDSTESAPQGENGSSDPQEVWATMNNDQKNLVYTLVGMSLEQAGLEPDMQQSDEEGDDDVSHNIFENQTPEGGATLTHDAMQTIFADAQRCGSLKEAVLAHAQEYGITNIDMLFPEARNVNGATPEFIKRKTEWVDGVLNGVHHSPFTRIKMTYADITADEARAKGYIKGNMKKEEFFSLSKREIGPTTIYKKQKLDRDDIIDITDFDVVSWIKSEMRMMLNEEIARAILIGDGREVDDPDHIDATKLIPIVAEAELYATKVTIPASSTPDDEIDALIKIMDDFEGSGTPNMYLPRQRLIDYKLIKDKNGRRIYSSETEIANLIGVGRMVEVPVMKGVKVDGKELVGIIVNLADYTVGTDKGGQISFFDDFDIDYNQYKYLYETRISGCLTKMKSAVIVLREGGTSGASESGRMVRVAQ